MSENAHPWDGAEIRNARRRLLEFFDELRRELPWRDAKDPYRIWVSEVMLQQTRVDTVVPYYRRWMERFPTLSALAGAEQEEVLRLWQGLGYYSRARNLHRAAREVQTEYGGRLPSAAKGLRALPGIGEYTAGAVASIAFGQAEPAVDGNVRRVLARLMDDPAPTPARLRRWASGLVDPDRPGDFNQALMELGALVCTPRSPDCGRCPVRELCAARAAGTQEERPARKRRGPVPHLAEAVLVLWCGPADAPEVWLRRRPERGLLGGMWECPSREVESGGSNARSVEEELEGLLADHVITPDGPALTALPAVDHAFSHRKVTYLPHRVRVDRAVLSGSVQGQWVPLHDRSRVPLPVAQEAILGNLEEALGLLHAPPDTGAVSGTGSSTRSRTNSD